MNSGRSIWEQGEMNTHGCQTNGAWVDGLRDGFS